MQHGGKMLSNRVGNSADLVIFDCRDTKTAVTELAQPLCGFERGQLIFTRPAARLQRGGEAASLPVIDPLSDGRP
jgi:hypothetical protein